MGLSSETEDRRLRRRWDFLLLLLALLMSFVCIFASTWLALKAQPDRLASANMLPVSQADYRRLSGESTRFAPLNPNVGAEAATDAARLDNMPLVAGGTPGIVVLLPPTPTPTPSAARLPTATGPVGVSTPSPTVATPVTPTPTDTPLPSPSPTATATMTGTPSSTPTATTTNTPTSTATGTPTGTPTPTSTPSSTPTPTATTPPPEPPDDPEPPPPAAPAPIVQAIAPDMQVNTALLPVTITGLNFQAGCSASLGSTLLVVSSCTSDTILASVPADIVAGYYNLTVTNPDSQFDTLTPAYTATNPIPTITAITPNTWFPISDGTFTITGDNFRNAGAPGGLRAELEGTSLTTITYVSPTTLTAVVPAKSAGMAMGVYTLTVTNPGPTNPTGSLANAFRVTTYTLPITVTCSASGVDNCSDAEGVPDTQVAGITGTGVITFDFGIGQGITDNTGYDMIYYEWPNIPGIQLDYVTVELSEDGVDWYTVFDWDGVPGGVAGTNIDSYATDGDGEYDNEPIQSADLYPGGLSFNTGIAIDIGGVLPPLPPGGSFRFVRFTHPSAGTQPSEVDAVVRLN